MKLIMTDHFVDESLAEKARWFASLSIEERIAWLDEWTEIILQNNPEVLKYVVIGGIAAILHGVPLMTGDIDLFIFELI